MHTVQKFVFTYCSFGYNAGTDPRSAPPGGFHPAGSVYRHGGKAGAGDPLQGGFYILPAAKQATIRKSCAILRRTKRGALGVRRGGRKEQGHQNGQVCHEKENAKGPFWVRHYRGVRMSKKTTDETLGREAVKEYLQQYHTAVGKKRILEERHRVLSSELRAPSTGSAFRLTPPTKPTKTDGSVSVVFRISEVEDRIEEQREEMAKAVLNVMDLIDVLPANSTERTVVEMRHIDCRGWDKIAEALYMSRSNVFNYYNAALDKILENKRNRKLLEEYMARKQQRAGPHGRNNRP